MCAVINTWERITRMDGRYPHWVTGYSGERYSVVFYRTEGTRRARSVAVPPMKTHGETEDESKSA